MRGLLVYITDLVEKIWGKVRTISTSFKWVWAEAKKFGVGASILTIPLDFSAFKQNFKFAILTILTEALADKFKFISFETTLTDLTDGKKMPKRESILPIPYIAGAKKFLTKQVVGIIPSALYRVSKVKDSLRTLVLETQKEVEKHILKMNILNLSDSSDAKKPKTDQAVDSLSSYATTHKQPLVKKESTILSYAIVEKHERWIIPPPRPILRSVSTPSYLLILR